MLCYKTVDGTAVLSALEERMAEPTARGLAAAVGRAVADGVLAAEDRLPPIRTVAAQLGLSPTTVSAAWAVLARAGTVHTAGRRGTVVTAHRAGPQRYRRAVGAHTPFALDLSGGTPDPELLPDLTAALRRVRPPLTPASYLDDPVLPELAALLRADWPFAAGRLTVVDGAMDALAQIVAAHLRFGDRVAVEQPAFPPLLDLLDAAGVAPVPVRIDDSGPVPAELASAVRAGVRAVFLQPRAQNPTGASLTPDRLAELAAVLQAGDALLVEDDSAGPIATPPALSLGSARPERTLHVRSYTTSHGPDLRLAAIGGPAALVDPLVERRFLGQGWTSRLLQALLVDLLTHAPSLHAVARARRTYARRRTTVAGELARLGVDVWRGDGINMWLPVRDEAAALLLLATRGIGAAPGGPFQLGSSDRPHLRVTVGLVASGHREVAAALADAAAAGARPAPPR
jgi:DNA-binding transcriptional MocR family regulator